MNNESKTRTKILPTGKILLWSRKLSVWARIVENFGEELNQLVDYLTGTMYEHNGVGLAAPQIGCFLRVAVVQLIEERSRPPLVLVNPTIVNTAGEITGWEGCLSLPGERTRARVKRPRILKVLFQDINGVSRQMECTDMMARAVQHEVDHLEGRFFIDRIGSVNRKVVVQQFERQAHSKDEADMERVFMRACPFENDRPIPAVPREQPKGFKPRTVCEAIGLTPFEEAVEPIKLMSGEEVGVAAALRVAETELNDTKIQLGIRATAVKNDGGKMKGLDSANS